MASISEEFKDQKINDLLEDYIELEKKIGAVSEQVISLLEGTGERFDKSVTDGVQRLHSEIDISLKAWGGLIQNADERSLKRIQDVAELINSIEKEGGEYITNLSAHLAEEKKGIIEEGVRAKESFYLESLNVMVDMRKELAKQAEAYKPMNKHKVMGYAFGGGLLLSIVISSVMYYFINQQAESRMERIARESIAVIELMNKKIDMLPADKREQAKSELKYILK